MESSLDQQPEYSEPEYDDGFKERPFYKWTEITGEFFESIKELQLGELMHHEFFGLFEAMSAIEMMDSRMDAGMCCNKEKTPLTFDTAVQSGQLKLEDLEVSELIGLMDGMFSCLVSWLDGHSLAQTLFTCLYLHNTPEIKDKYLANFCNGMLKVIGVILKFVTGARVYEEEDFQPGTYKYNLCTELSDQKVVSMLKEIEVELCKKTKEPEADRKTEELEALLSRIKFIRLLLQSLLALYPSKGLSPVEAEMTEISRLLSAATDSMPTIKKTVHLGTQPEADMPNKSGFSPMVNQRLLPPTFPRYTKIKDRLSSLTYLEELTHNLKMACKIIYCVNYHSAMNFFMEFSKKSGQCLLSRSVLQILYLPCPNKVFGTTDLTEVLKESVKSFIAPPVLLPKNPLMLNPQAKECVDSFFFYNEHTFVLFLEICGFNRARQRDKLARLLDNFASLQDESERVDSYLHKLSLRSETSRPHLACFGTWVLYHSLRAMSLFLLSGLELELYSIHEYLYVFWYLYEFLFGWVISALTRADSFLLEQECITEQFKSLSRGQKKTKLKKKKMKPYGREIMFNQAMQNMAGGYYKGLAGFIREERIPQPLSEFDFEQVRYEHRFAPFADLTTPSPMQYADFKRVKLFLLNSTGEDLFAHAAKHFQQARCILEQIPNLDHEMNEILKIAKINFVVMNLLANGHKKGSKIAPEFDFSAHRYFPIIKQL